MKLRLTWIQITLILTLQVTALAADAHQSAFAVRAGDDITVPCGNVTGGQGDCDGTVWTFRGSAGAAELVAPAQSHGPVTGSCSLVIEKVSLEDAGRYTCRRSKAGSAGGSEVHVDLAVVHMTQHDGSDTVTLTCSVLEFNPCTHTVEWLHEGEEDVSSDVETSPGSCSSAVTFTTSLLNQGFHEALKCNVTNNSSNKVQLFAFSPPTSGWSWEHFTFPALAALSVVAVVIITRKKIQGSNMGMDGPNTAEPEDDVSLASLSFTGNTRNEQ